MNRREFLEFRRKAHEDFLRRRGGPKCSLSIEGRQAVARLWNGLTLRFPARALFDHDALRRLGF